MFRLVAYAPDGVRRFPVLKSESFIGSQPDCDICLPYTGVALRHAVLRYDGTSLRIEDLGGNRKGLQVSGRKVRESALEVMDEIRVGAVTLLVEDVMPAPQPAPPGLPAEPVPAGPPRNTPERMVEHLCRISEWVLSDTESRTTSEDLVSEVLTDFGGGVFFLLQGEVEKAGLKLVVSSDPSWLASGERLLEQLLVHRQAGHNLQRGGALEGELAGAEAWICYHSFTALDRTYTLMSAFPAFRRTPRGRRSSRSAPSAICSCSVSSTTSAGTSRSSPAIRGSRT